MTLLAAEPPLVSARIVRCAIYLRISRDDAHNGLAIERQREDALAIAASRGWEVFQEYVDHGISAYSRTTRRPAYEQMRADYAAGLFDALVCWDLDRLTRQPVQLEAWIELAEGRGLRIVTASGEADLTNDNGRTFARIKAAIARGEMDRKSERQKRAIAQKVENGRVLAGVRLTGYDSQGGIVEGEAAYIREAFERFAAGDSLKGIAKSFEERGITTRRGGTWNASTLLGILRNPRYCGRAVFKGETTGHLGDWEAIVDEGLFDVVQARLDDPRRRTNKVGTARKWLGSGLYLCGVEGCGRPVTTNSRYYWCREGGHINRGMDAVDEFVMDLMRGRLSKPDALDVFAHRDDEAIAALAEKATAATHRLATIEADYDAGLIDGRRYKAASDRVVAELKEMQTERARLVGGTALAGIMASDDPVRMFEGAPVDVQRTIIDAFLTVTLLPVKRGSHFDPMTVVTEWKGQS